MSTIDQLLNPLPAAAEAAAAAAAATSLSDPSSSRKSNSHDTDDEFLATTRKKIKLCKDAAVFTRGPMLGQCRYPPYEAQSDLLSAKHAQFQIYPKKNIADYPRHIPYSSEKKLFLQKTGRESLEVFQYEFKVPGSEITYSMLWDYNIGLVRTTPLFKCTGHSKTTPAKMLNRNAGLREICHSITGGALVAQGYWMPFEAAKAVAATFCWQIRYALTPVFGPEFPDMCLPPDHPKHGDMTIDISITKRCAAEAQAYRDLESDVVSRNSTATPIPSPLISDTPGSFASKTFTATRPRASDSVYSSDTSIDARTPLSNPPRSVACSSIPTAGGSEYGKYGNDTIEHDQSPVGRPGHQCSETDDGYDGDSSSTEHGSLGIAEACHTPQELEVAHIMLNLKEKWDSARGATPTRKRRASA